MRNNPKIGLVTITYNSSDVIDDFLSSVKGQTYKNLKLYVVDNNSADNTLDKVLLVQSGIDTAMIRNDINAGVAAGNNQGIKKALEENCDYIMLVNNDTVFEEKLVEKLVNYLMKENISIVAPKMMYYDEPERIWYGGGKLNRWRGYLNEHCGFKELDRGQFKTGMEITYAPTCCVLFHYQVFKDIGLMDEKYFVYFDDTDFFYRILIDGKHKMRFYNDVKFYHKVGSLSISRIGKGESIKFSIFKIHYSIRNMVYYFLKQKNAYTYFYMSYMIFKLHILLIMSARYRNSDASYMDLYKYLYYGFRLYLS